MRAALRSGSAAAGPKVKMSFALHSDAFDLHLVSESTRELLVVGPAADRLMAVDATTGASEIVLSDQCAARLPNYAVERRNEVNFLRRPPRMPANSQRDRASGCAGELAPVPAEFRRAAIGFVQLTGAFALHARSGPAAVNAALHTAISVLTAVFEEYGVTYLSSDISTDGCKLLAAAGVPVTHEANEARLVGALGAAMPLLAASGLAVRAGVDTGVVLAGEVGSATARRYSVFGDAVNTAARVMGAADSGELLVTARTYEHCAAAFVGSARDAITAKGKAQPVGVVAIAGPGEGAPGLGLHGPYIGRTSELEFLQTAALRAAAGHGGVVEIYGPAGIGKTRLVREALARSDIASVSVDCLAHRQHVPLATIRSLLHRLAGAPHSRDGWPLWVAATAPELMPWLPLLARIVGFDVNPTPEVDSLVAAAVPRRTSEVVVALLDHVLRRPTVIVVEDVGWIDASSAELLSVIADAARERPWLVITTARTAPTSPRGDVVAVASLDPDTARSLVRALRPEPMLPGDRDALVERAGGNPLFLTELVRTAGTGVESVETVESILVAQVDELHPHDRGLLRIAAVMGGVARADLIEALARRSGDQSPETRWRRIDAFVEYGTDATVRFRHPLAREAAYDAMPHRVRRAVHAQVADALEGASGADSAVLSYHLEMAGDYAGAWTTAMAAGYAARERYASYEAMALFERALRVAKWIPELSAREKAEGYLRFARECARSDHNEEAYRALRTSRRLTDDPSVVAQVLLTEGAMRADAGEFARSARLLRRAEEIFRTIEGDEAALGRRQTLHYQGWTEFRRHRDSTAERFARDLIALAGEAGDAANEAWAHRLLATIFQATRRPPADDVDHEDVAYSLFVKAGDPSDLAAAQVYWGERLRRAGRIQESVALVSAAHAAFVQQGQATQAAQAASGLVETLIEMGRFAEALAYVEEAIDSRGAARKTQWNGWFMRLAGKAAAGLGRADEAVAWFDASIASADDLDEMARLIEIERDLVRGDLAGAAKRVGSFETDLPPGYVTLLEHLRGVTLLMQDRLAEAVAAFDAAADAAVGDEAMSVVVNRFIAEATRRRIGSGSEAAMRGRRAEATAFGIERLLLVGYDVLEV